jgi:hypothetical protein
MIELPSVVIFPKLNSSSRIWTLGITVVAMKGTFRILLPLINIIISPFTVFSSFE